MYLFHACGWPMDQLNSVQLCTMQSAHLSNPFMQRFLEQWYQQLLLAVRCPSSPHHSFLVSLLASCLIARKRGQKDTFTSAGVNPPVEQSPVTGVE